MPRSRHRRSTRLASQVIGLGFAVPEVVAHRLNRIALAGSSPSSDDRDEFYRMGAEKVWAFYESWNGMLLAMWRANWKLLLSGNAWAPVWMSPRRRAYRWHTPHAALDVLASGLAPIHRRAIANAKRFRK